MILSDLLAVLAAISNAWSNVLQRVANRQEPPEVGLSPRLIADLVRRPVWLAGIGLVIASFLLQGGALYHGQLAAVQPIIILELPLTLLFAKLVFKSRITRREWVAIALCTGGLAALVAALDPSGGTNNLPDLRWLIGGGASVAIVAALVAGAHRTQRRQMQAALYGAATGVTFGLTAALMKSATGRIAQGFTSLVEAWPTWAMVLAGFTAMLLFQSALHAGSLVAAQPGVSLLDPFTSIAWGILGFHESTNSGPVLAVAALGALALAAGAVLLSLSPAVRQTLAEPGDEAPADARNDAAGGGRFDLADQGARSCQPQ